MWVQEIELGATLEKREAEALMRSAYELIVEKLPKSKRPGAKPIAGPKKAVRKKRALARARR